MGLLNAVASKGRNGDTRMAHVTPGEVVIPKEVAALRPDLVAHVSNQIRAMGGNPDRTVVGKGRKNPKTGIEEFATEAEIRASYKSVLGREPDVAGLQGWLGQTQMSASDIQKAFASSAEGQTKLASDISKVTSAPGYDPRSGTEKAANPGVAYSPPASAASTPTGILSAVPTTTVPPTPAMPNWGTLYQSTFGRPADKAGSDYWTSEYNKNPNQDWGAMLAKNAQGQDLNARDDILGGKVDTSKAWDASRNSLDQSQLTYDPNTDRWVLPSVKEQTQAAFAAPTVTPSYLDINALTHRTVAPNETVSGNVNTLLNEDGQYIQDARNRSLMQMNERGLINSSIAGQAGQQAAIQAALQIATPDAASFGRAADYNASLENQGTMFNATEQNKVASQQLGISGDAASQQRAIDAQMGLSKQEIDARAALQVKEFESQIKTANLNNTANLSAQIIANNNLSPEIKSRLLNSLAQAGLAGGILKGGKEVIQSLSGDLISAPAGSEKTAATAAIDTKDKAFSPETGTTGKTGQPYTISERRRTPLVSVLTGVKEVRYSASYGDAGSGRTEEFDTLEEAHDWVTTR